MDTVRRKAQALERLRQGWRGVLTTPSGTRSNTAYSFAANPLQRTSKTEFGINPEELIVADHAQPPAASTSPPEDVKGRRVTGA